MIAAVGRQGRVKQGRVGNREQLRGNCDLGIMALNRRSQHGLVSHGVTLWMPVTFLWEGGESVKPVNARSWLQRAGEPVGRHDMADKRKDIWKVQLDASMDRRSYA